MAPRFACFGRCSSGSDHISPKQQQVEKAATEPRKLGPVVVELFSSQGCTTSTEAETVLSRFGRGDFNSKLDGRPLILLAYHVDYWDYTGWKDPFGSSQWTVRQKAYVEALNLDTMFTPQIVVQGRTQCIANDPDAILSCISTAERVAAPSLRAAFQKTAEALLQVTVTGSLKWKAAGDEGGGYVVVAALYECGQVTECGGGANKGKVLANDYIVRRLEKVCCVGGNKNNSSSNSKSSSSVKGTVSLALWEGFNPAKSGLAVFVQNSSHHIFGSQNFRLPENM